VVFEVTYSFDRFRTNLRPPCGAGNAYPSGAPDFISGFHRGSRCPVICVSLFHVILSSFDCSLFDCLVSIFFTYIDLRSLYCIYLLIYYKLHIPGNASYRYHPLTNQRDALSTCSIVNKGGNSIKLIEIIIVMPAL